MPMAPGGKTHHSGRASWVDEVSWSRLRKALRDSIQHARGIIVRRPHSSIRWQFAAALAPTNGKPVRSYVREPAGTLSLWG